MLLLRPADPLRHRRLGHEKRVGDFGGREAAYGAQRERDRGRPGERGMAAHEEQDERVVLLELSRRSSAAVKPARSAGDCIMTVVSRRRRAISARTWSVMRRAAT